MDSKNTLTLLNQLPPTTEFAMSPWWFCFLKVYVCVVVYVERAAGIKQNWPNAKANSISRLKISKEWEIKGKQNNIRMTWPLWEHNRPTRINYSFSSYENLHMRHVSFIHNKQPETMNIVRQLNCFLIEERGSSGTPTPRRTFPDSRAQFSPPPFDSSRLVSWEYRGHNRTDKIQRILYKLFWIIQKDSRKKTQ